MALKWRPARRASWAQVFPVIHSSTESARHASYCDSYVCPSPVSGQPSVSLSPAKNTVPRRLWTVHNFFLKLKPVRTPGSTNRHTYAAFTPLPGLEGWSNWASRTRKRGETCGGQPGRGGEWAATTVKRPLQQPAQPQCASYWAALTRKRHHEEHRPQAAVRTQ